MKLYQQFAQTWQARENCETGSATESMRANRAEWQQRHTDRAIELVKQHMPSGSGFDNGTTLDFGATRPNRIVFNTAFHHMDEHGSYCGWTEHQVIVTPSLVYGFELRVTGRDRRNIKDFIADTFQTALNSEISE